MTFGMVNFGSIITDVETEQQQITTEFIKIKTWNQDGLARILDPEIITNNIILPVNGDYNVSFTISFKGTNERVYTLSLFQDGVEVPEIRAERYFGPNLKTGDMSFEGVINVSSAPSTIDVRAKCDISDANVMIVKNAILSCFELPPATTGTTNITASTTQTQGEVPLSTEINEVSVVANTNDVVTLQTAVAFIQVIIINNGLKKLQIFPANGDDLGNGVNSSTSLLSGSNIHFVAYNNTNWEMV